MGEVHRCTGRGRANLLNTLNADDVCLGGRSGRACPAGASWCHSTTRPRQQQRPDRSSRSVHAFTVGAGPASLALAPTSQPLVPRGPAPRGGMAWSSANGAVPGWADPRGTKAPCFRRAASSQRGSARLPVGRWLPPRPHHAHAAATPPANPSWPRRISGRADADRLLLRHADATEGEPHLLPAAQRLLHGQHPLTPSPIRPPGSQAHRSASIRRVMETGCGHSTRLRRPPPCHGLRSP